MPVNAPRSGGALVLTIAAFRIVLELASARGLARERLERERTG